ncbi:MAG: carbohydrate ABC transporter permease, partial [Desulfovibrionales bacterium]|nr:carbohydrate ABC transporter permease [Desulfovibrionales bacterium]
MTRKLSPGAVLLYGILAVMVILYLLPAYMALVTALKIPAEISLPTAWEWPASVNWSSFSEALLLLKPNLVNSLILTISATALSTVLGSL